MPSVNDGNTTTHLQSMMKSIEKIRAETPKRRKRKKLRDKVGQLMPEGMGDIPLSSIDGNRSTRDPLGLDRSSRIDK